MLKKINQKMKKIIFWKINSITEGMWKQTSKDKPRKRQQQLQNIKGR